MGTHIPILLLFRYMRNVTVLSIGERIVDFLFILALEIPIVLLIRRYAPFLIGKIGQSEHKY